MWPFWFLRKFVSNGEYIYLAPNALKNDKYAVCSLLHLGVGPCKQEISHFPIGEKEGEEERKKGKI